MNVWISTKIAAEFVLPGPIDDKFNLGDSLEPVMTDSKDAYLHHQASMSRPLEYMPDCVQNLRFVVCARPSAGWQKVTHV